MSSAELVPPASPRGHHSAAQAWTVGIIGLLLIGLHAAGLLDPDAIYTMGVAAVAAVVATVVGLTRHRPVPRWPWLSVAAALALFLVADVLRVALGTMGDLSMRRIVPDLFALPGYVLLGLGVAGLAGLERKGPDDVDAILDAAIAALAFLTLAWAYLVVPAVSTQDVSLAVELIIVAYPVASVFVLAMGCRLAFSRGRRTSPALWLSLGAIACLLVGDVVWALTDTSLVDIPAHLGDVPYSLAFLCYTVALLHPSVRNVSQPRTSDEKAPTRGRLAVVAVALFIPTIVLFTDLGSTRRPDRVALAVIGMLLVAVTTWRTSRALRQHADSQTRLAFQATHDALTGLPNRTLLSEQVERALQMPNGEGATVTLLHVDIDRFRLVNDTMGHGIGDALLVAVAERLAGKVRAGDLVGRVGGDEFLIVVRGLANEGAALDFGSRAQLMFKEPFRVNGTEIPVTASVGVAFAGAEHTRCDELLRDADTALNHAKPGGGDSVAIYDASMREHVAERLLLERELRDAVAKEDLTLHFQPKLRMLSGQVVGLEALARWPHRELGMVRPDKFIAIAEDTGMIVEMGAWVIDRACAELARLRETFKAGAGLHMSVNVSARQLRSETLVDTIARALLDHGIPPDRLCLELTESILMENLQQVRPQLEAIRASGTHISIDDFGTGYSSLAYLSQLPVDEIKIDRTFVRDLNQPGGASVIQAVVDIASALGITTVAEGVETEQEADRLRALGCTEVQGYLYGRPSSSADLDDLLVELGLVRAPHLRSVDATEGPRIWHSA